MEGPGKWMNTTLGCFLMSSDGAVGLKDIGVGSPREILPAVWVYRNVGGVSKDSDWTASMNRGLEKILTKHKNERRATAGCRRSTEPLRNIFECL